MRVLILGYFRDEQTGIYIMDSFRKYSSDITAIDTRMLVKDFGNIKGQEMILKEIGTIEKAPDIIMILKGTEISHETVIEIKDRFPDAVLCNWFFDKFLGDKPIYENKSYFKTLRLYDYFFCSLKGVADKLVDLGFDNAKYVDEACHPSFNGEEFVNSYQKVKYGSDVSFIGSLGFFKQHGKRDKILNKIITEGFYTKIWGPIVCEWNQLPYGVQESHTKTVVINKDHSKVAQSSLINIGIDQDTDIKFGHSARLYRILCAGGLYLVNGTKCIGDMFKVNGRGKPITGDEEVVVYFDEFDLIKKIDFLLEHEDIRKKIAKNGQKIVLKKHKFIDRIGEILEVFKKDGRRFK